MSRKTKKKKNSGSKGLIEMYVCKGFEFVINLLVFVFLNLNFKLRHVDFYYLGPIATTILMLDLKKEK